MRIEAIVVVQCPQCGEPAKKHQVTDLNGGSTCKCDRCGQLSLAKAWVHFIKFLRVAG